MFRRKIELILEDWLKSKDHNRIVIKGARQCGKTYSVRHFAETHFDNVVYMDFHMNPNLKRCFNDRLDAETILMNISLSLPHVDFVTKKHVYPKIRNTIVNFWQKSAIALLNQPMKSSLNI